MNEEKETMEGKCCGAQKQEVVVLYSIICNCRYFHLWSNW